jgi:hypothetical protein
MNLLETWERRIVCLASCHQLSAINPFENEFPETRGF